MKHGLWLALVFGTLVRAGHVSGADPADLRVREGDRLMQEARDRVAHDFADAEKAYRQAMEIDPDHPGALVGMAWVRNSEHRFDQGRRWARRALEVDPGLADAYSLMGDGAVEGGRYDEAAGHYRKALELRGDLASASRHAQLLWLRGDDRGARLWMARAVRAGGAYPENAAWCLAELSGMHRMNGAMAAAEQSAAKALALAPKHPRSLAAMAAVRATQGRRDDAIRLYEASVAAAATHEALAALVDLRTLSGDEDRAAEAVRRVLEFHGAEEAPHHHHGHTHHHGTGNAQLALFLADHDLRIADAVHEAEHAYEAFPNVRHADALAWCYFKAGRLEDAGRMIAKALAHGTPDPLYHFHAGMIQARRGEEPAARSSLARALNLNPEFHCRDADRARAELGRLSGPRR